MGCLPVSHGAAESRWGRYSGDRANPLGTVRLTRVGASFGAKRKSREDPALPAHCCRPDEFLVLATPATISPAPPETDRPPRPKRASLHWLPPVSPAGMHGHR